MFSIYDLIKACILFTNAVAIINERFLIKVGCERPTIDSPQTIKNRILTLLYGDFKMILQMPLIWINIILILVEVVFG